MSTPEQRARAEIDRLLGLAGWAVQSVGEADLHAARGIKPAEIVVFGSPQPMVFRSPRDDRA